MFKCPACGSELCFQHLLDQTWECYCSVGICWVDLSATAATAELAFAAFVKKVEDKEDQGYEHGN